MNPNPEIGNRLIILVAAGVLAILSLFVQWGTITLTAEDFRSTLQINEQPMGFGRSGSGGNPQALTDAMTSMGLGMKVPVTGQTGNFWGMPSWLAIIVLLFALVIMALNLIGFSAVPRPFIVVLLMFGLAAATGSIVLLVSRGSLGIGAFLLLAAAVIGLSQTRRATRRTLPV